MSTYKPDCRKFQANIFNKSKCTNCFRQREEHSTDALDSNRASRRISKCGYLFVAPDWDFTIPLYRTKRWQRRWFVLYDDGELTYSVDDLTGTIPQDVIDMNRVLEVSSAEDVTGNQFSLAITSPDRVTFVKGTSREESRWWQDVLSVFPRMHKHGRHKRNATFPGIKGSSGPTSASSPHQAARPGAPNRSPNTMESPVNQRSRFHSISSDLRGSRRPCSAPSLDTQQFARHKQFTTTTSSQQQYDSVTESSNGSDNSNDDDDPLSQARRAEDSGAYSDEIEKNNQKNSYYSSKNRQVSSVSSFNDSSSAEYGSSNTTTSSSTITPFNSLLYSRSNPIPTPSPAPSTRSGLSTTSGSTGLLTSTPSRLRDDHKENTPPYAPDYDDNPPTSESPPTQDKQAHRLRTRRALNREARALSQPRGELETSSVLADLEATKREEKLKDIAASITTTSSRRRQYHHLHHQQSKIADKPTRDRDTDDVEHISDPTDTPPPSQVRGAPDGCGGVEDGGSISLPRVDLPAEDLLFIKKGWLFKPADNQEFNKHWFVLQGTGLRFYRNSSAEEAGILDGIIDLGTAEDIHNLDVESYYGFVIKTWSDQQFVFSAVTARIRSNWVVALRNAAGLDIQTASSASKESTNAKDSLSKTATIESFAAERDSSFHNKSLLANNKKNASQFSKSNSSILESFSTPNGLSKTHLSTNDSGICKIHDGGKPEDGSEIRTSSRVAMSSDDEYKTASETSAASNLSNDNADFFDWDGSRLPNAVGSSGKKVRSQSSPPNSRRGTSDSFPSSESSFGLSKNILDRYKNMQSLTTRHSTPVPSKANTDELDSGPPDDSHSTPQCNLDICDTKSTCAKMSTYSGAAKEGVSALKPSDSLRSLDLEGSIHHDKVSSSGTLASGSGDALLVDLLETQVETLKAKLEATQNASSVPHEDLHLTNEEVEEMRLKLNATEDSLGDALEQLSAMQSLNDMYEEKSEQQSRENLSGRKELEEVKEEAVRYQKQLEEHCSTILRLQSCVDESDSLLGRYRHQGEEKDEELKELHRELKETRGALLKKDAQLDALEAKITSEAKLLKDQLDVTRLMLQEEEQRNVELEEAKMNAEEENACARQELVEALNRIDYLHEEVEQLARQVNAKDQQLTDQFAAYRDLRLKHEEEKATWRAAGEGGEAEQDAVSQLKSSLEESERRVATLRARLDSRDVADGLGEGKSVSILQAENAALLVQLNECHDEIIQLKESVKCEKSEVYKWKDLVKELRSLLDGRNVDMDRKREEIRLVRESLRSAQQEHEVTRDKLHRGIEENETLSGKLRELQRQISFQDKRTSSVPSVYSRDKLSSRRHLPRFDSLSDLSNVDFALDPDALDRDTLNDEYCNVRSRLELSLNEIRALRRELRESQSEHDALQLTHLQLSQDCARQRQEAGSQLALMTDRVQDLANKLTYSEKQVRQMKTKMNRAESRDRRRAQSLRGKDAVGVSRDVEVKLCQLEARIDQLMPTIDMGADGTQSSVPSVDDCRLSESQRSSFSSKHISRTTKRSKSFDDPTKSSRLRRKSLESSAASGDGVKAALRISSLEAKVAALTPARSASPSAITSPAHSPSSGRSKGRSTGERHCRSRRVASDGESFAASEATAHVMSRISLQLGECVEWLDAYRCSCGRAGLSSLHRRLSCLYRLAAADMPLPPAPHPLSLPSEKLLPIVHQVVLLLQQKLAALNETRQNLKNSNSWTKEAQLKNFAQRVAYETVLIGQVSQALRLCNQSNCNIESIKLQDLMESHRKIAFLEKKLTNPEFDLETMAPLEFYTSMLAEKLVVTGEVLASVNNQESHEKRNTTLSATCRDLQARLLERERLLALLISNYKEEKLHEIAVVMTQENRVTATLDQSVLLEEVRIREAWVTAHQLLVQEIINHQTSQSLLRMTNMLNLTDDSAPPLVPSTSSLSLTLCSAEAVDRLQAAAEESLKQEMEESVLTLSQKYEEILAQQRAGDTSLVNSVSASMENVLNEFASVMAQKALIDGHLALLQEEFDKSSIPTAQNSLMICEDGKDPMESAVDVLDSEAHLVMFLGGKDPSIESLVKPALCLAEFTFLYNKGVYQGSEDARQLLSQILKKTEGPVPASSSSFRSSSVSLHQVSPVESDRDQDGSEQPRLRSAISMSKINPSPKSRRKHESRKSRRSSDITGMTSLGCKMCEELRHELSKLKKKQQLLNSEETRCTNCPKLLDTIERLEAAQRARIEQLLPGDSDQTLAAMENRIMVLEAAYEAKITALELQYKQALASHPDCGDDTIRQKYQKEIEELRGLCEKGLGTMEISTQRIVAEIKEKHRQELSLLQAEKEQALAEETQATLAALDAMRKAHEAEVQREVAKMKEEFILKMQAGKDLGELSQRHEAEMRDIRREILSLSEKYSVKCLESADLETKVDNLAKQLNDASQTIADLESRNNKLKGQLTEKITSLKAGTTEGDAESELRVCIAETILKDDKLAKMGAELQRIQAHEGEVMEVCRHLRHFLRSDRPILASDQLTSVTDRLEHLMLTAPTALREHSEGSQQQRQARPALRRPKVYSSKELTRSPSCPRLGTHPARLSCPSVASDDFLHCFPLPNSPLSGMVASRKKVFENADGCSNLSKS